LLLWIGATAVVLVVVVTAVYVAAALIVRALRSRPLAARLVGGLRAPVAGLAIAGTAASALAGADVPRAADDRLAHAAAIASIIAVAWSVARAIGVLADEWVGQLRIDRADNLRARAAWTQLVVIRRLAVVVVWTLAAAAGLWTFEEVRTLGASLLASAGVIGIVAGIAAKSSIGNLFAGLQLAFAAPIRYDDVVVVDGQWGRIEDISLTYVVVRTWDQRRVILPCTWFTEHPFENWTRPTSDLLAPVELELDHRVDVDDVRRCVDGLVDGHPLWDGRTNVVQVTGAGPSTITVRVLLSARGASEAFDLRCDVREGLVAHLREHQPGALPGVRARLDDVARSR
jgi:small-conductance mechanosensitive channel